MENKVENIQNIVNDVNSQNSHYEPTKEDFTIVGPDTAQSEVIYKPSLTFWQDGWRRFKKNKLALTFLGVTLVFIFLAIFGQMLTKYSYREQDLAIKFLKPSEGIKTGHYLGTDNLGRDLFARLSQGIRISMELSIITAIICVVFWYNIWSYFCLFWWNSGYINDKICRSCNDYTFNDIYNFINGCNGK